MNLSLFKDGVLKDLRRKIYGFLSEILHFGLKLKISTMREGFSF
jgi:hypothetical protein